jgi:hypothetical protein
MLTLAGLHDLGRLARTGMCSTFPVYLPFFAAPALFLCVRLHAPQADRIPNTLVE